MFSEASEYRRAIKKNTRILVVLTIYMNKIIL